MCIRDRTQGPNVWAGYGTIENSYYFSDKIFNNTKDIKASEFALYDIEFQNKIINSENRFNVASLIKQGYFPWLNFENCMPKQQFIKLPELKDEDLADVISVEILEKNNDSAKAVSYTHLINNNENDKANNSLKERKYINIYNAEKDEYQIYQEKELLDTTKQEVVSENDKIEANNLKEYYASEGKSRNKNMGILWITLSIVGVVIILFAIKKRD